MANANDGTDLSEGLSHYVNTCGNNLDNLVPLYLMAYRNTTHGTTKHTTYYMLYGREMISHPCSPFVLHCQPMFVTRSTDHVLRTSSQGYVLLTKWRETKVADRTRTINAITKKRAKHREFEFGDTVYLYNPAVKKGV